MYDYSLQSESARGDGARTGKLRDILLRRGFLPSASLTEISAALDLGAETLGGDLVPAGTVRDCELRTRRCFFRRVDAAGLTDGFIALLYLNEAGYQALMYGRFSPSEPDHEHLCEPDERATAIYVWCLAGATPEARRAVTEARRRAFPDIALFARPVSREGRMMTAALDRPGGGAFLGWVPAQNPSQHQKATEDE
jgi:hypothetical protein